MEAKQPKTKLRRSDCVHLMQMAKGGHVLVAIMHKDPRNVKEALTGPDAELWREAMLKEIHDLVENGTWELVAKPQGVNIVDHKWVFKVKFNSTGEVDKFKARLVARCFTQRYGVNFTKTYSPVIKMPSVRLLLGLADNIGTRVMPSIGVSAEW